MSCTSLFNFFEQQFKFILLNSDPSHVAPEVMITRMQVFVPYFKSRFGHRIFENEVIRIKSGQKKYVEISEHYTTKNKVIYFYVLLGLFYPEHMPIFT
jgi:hypothetical protein